MEDSENIWMNIADVMSALMMIFMFISIAFLYQILNEKEIYQVDLNTALHKEFDKDLVKWKADITNDNILRFDSPFRVGETDLPEEFSEILKAFFPRYIKLLSTDRFKNEITEIRVEGHTSNDWGDLTNKRKIYLNNMRLSQNRASNVLRFCYSLQNINVIHNIEWLQNKLRANGMSFSKPLLNFQNRNEDQVRSRRVEFRVIIKDNKKKRSAK